MKKLMIAVAVVAMSVAACGKKKAPAAPKTDNGSATMPAGDGSGSAATPAGDGSAAPAGGM